MESVKFTTLTVCLILLMSPFVIADKLYKWVDKGGVVHVTDDPEKIPKEHRRTVKEVIPENKIDKSLTEIQGMWKQIRAKGKLFGIGIGGLIVILLTYKLFTHTKPKLEDKKKESRLRALESSGIDNMNEYEFKNYLARLLAHRGYKVEASEGTFNLGVDFIAEKKGVKYAVQTKRYTGAVSKPVVSDLEREKHRYGCTRAMIVTNSYFTEDAVRLARSEGCELVDRSTLGKWISKFKKEGKA